MSALTEQRSGVATGSPESVGGLPLVVYFSSVSENTHRFVKKLDVRSVRIPLIDRSASLRISEPYVLVCPTYGGGKLSDAGQLASHAGAGAGSGASGPNRSGYVPKQVIKFLNVEANRKLLRGVIAAGNTNFGEEFAMAGDIVSAKCQVPYLYRFELMGTTDDVERVRAGLAEFAAGPAFAGR